MCPVRGGSDVYRLRTCLVHRGGLVTEMDAPSGVLSVTWRRIRLVANGVPVESLPIDLNAGEVLAFVAEESPREWHVDDHVALTLSDCHDIAHSLHDFVEMSS